MRIFLKSLVILLLCTACAHVPNEPTHSPAVELQEYYEVDPGMRNFVAGAYGYAIYPSVGKGGFGIGGAYGKGWVYEQGHFIGTSELVQVTYGLQIGGKAYSELVVFQDERSLRDFKKGNLQLSAQVSAVAVRTGGSANASYRNGVAIFTAAEKGLMGEISVGGQQFSFTPHVYQK
jgi:lipid-binding SYLF domain-containing protein